MNLGDGCFTASLTLSFQYIASLIDKLLSNIRHLSLHDIFINHQFKTTSCSFAYNDTKGRKPACMQLIWNVRNARSYPSLGFAQRTPRIRVDDWHVWAWLIIMYDYSWHTVLQLTRALSTSAPAHTYIVLMVKSEPLKETAWRDVG